MNTSLKTCFKCGAKKARTEFYRHSKMKDGLLGKCKACTKLDMKIRSKDPDARVRIAEYERSRFKTEHRKAKAIQYQRKMRQTSPEKYQARCAVSNAVRDGRLTRKPCEICGNPKSQAHHTDYSQPLSVRWLCFEHHRVVGHGQIINKRFRSEP